MICGCIRKARVEPVEVERPVIMSSRPSRSSPSLSDRGVISGESLWVRVVIEPGPAAG